MSWNKTIEILDTQGVPCKLHRWTPAESSSIRASCVIFHGFKAHAEYTTVRYFAEFLAGNNFAVFALDMPGHGLSPGLRGYVESHEVLVRHGVDVVRKANSCSSGQTKRLFLCGSSMGGAIALMVSKALQDDMNATNPKIGGIVMLAPMLQLGVSTPVRYLLRGLAFISPKFKIPTKTSNSELQYRDIVKRKEADEDSLAISGNTYFASACACVEICAELKEYCSSFNDSMLVMIADEDFLVDSVASARLAESFPSPDKTIQHYKALHGLLCEPQPLLGEIESNILEWIKKRA